MPHLTPAGVYIVFLWLVKMVGFNFEVGGETGSSSYSALSISIMNPPAVIGVNGFGTGLMRLA